MISSPTTAHAAGGQSSQLTVRRSTPQSSIPNSPSSLSAPSPLASQPPSPLGEVHPSKRQLEPSSLSSSVSSSTATSPTTLSAPSSSSTPAVDYGFEGRTAIQLRNLPIIAKEELASKLRSDFNIATRAVFVERGGKDKCMGRILVQQAQDVGPAIAALHNQPFGSSGAISAVVAPVDSLLFIGNIEDPTLLGSDAALVALARQFGDVQRAFLMRHPQTKAPLGYGFVEYIARSVAADAKTALCKVLGPSGRPLRVEWMDTPVDSLSALHSRSLYFDELPKTFRNIGSIRA